VLVRRRPTLRIRNFFFERGLMNFSRIVCAIDSSEMSRSVLAFAAALAKWENADLYVLHLTDRDEEARIQSPLIPGKRPATVLVRDDDPARAILAHAAYVEADLIVVGASLAAARTDHLGRLAESIAQRAECATLIAPLAAPYRREELPFRNILCPVDFSAGSVRAYDHALRFTQQAGGTLTLLHVVDEFRDRRGNVRVLQPLERQLRIAEARARLKLAISDESLNWCHVGVHVTAGAADVHIVAEAHRLYTDLIVMAMTPNDANPTGVVSMVGRVSRQVACPVLVVPAIGASPTWDDADDGRERIGALGPEQLASVRTVRRSALHVGGMV
jgi:nucleotide-binding universal stress UspA family protein